jgi:hypothetical protein
MGPGPLVNEQTAAGARFLGEFRKYAPVQAAFWLKESDEDHWNLYVASDQITDDNFDLAYGEVGRIAARLQDPWLDPFQVKVIGADHPLTVAALDALRRFHGKAPVRLHDTTFGGVSADDVYVYPSLAPVPVQ